MTKLSNDAGRSGRTVPPCQRKEVPKILESIFKGFAQWLNSLVLEIVQYIANSLLDVFTMDLDYFQRAAPVTKDILSIVVAAGWALLLGNLVFQAVKSMASGLGFEGEDPKLLFTRTFVFAFLLLASPEICEIGLGISASVIELLQVPNSVTISLPEEDYFNIGASWLLVIIVNFVIMWQVVKLFFEIAERYVVTAALVLLSPLAFATGGSKNTADIFKGWCRMFGSMCLMMVLNVVFLKLLISAMGHMPSDVGVLPWMLLIGGIARVARKADSIVARMGLNPAITGDGLGRGLPGMVAYAVVKSVGSTVAHSAGRSGSTGPRRSGGPAPGGRSTPPPTPPSGGGSGASRPAGNSAGGTSGTAGSSQGGTAPGNGAAKSAAAYAQQNSTGTSSSVTNPTVSNQQTQTVSGQGPAQQPVPGSGAKAQRPAAQGSRRTSVPPGTKTAWQNTSRSSAGTPGSTTVAASVAAAGGGAVQSQQERPERPPIPRAGQNSAKSRAPAPSDGGQAPKDTSRRTAAMHTTPATASGVSTSTHSSTRTNSRQQGQASKPIQQNGTPIISPPPGVGSSGKGERGRVNGAGTHKTSVPTQPPIGGGAAPSGSAGTRRTFAPTQPPVSNGASPSGTAGTRKTSAPVQPPVSGGAAPSGTAGTRRTSAPTQPPIGGGAASSGTAGTRKSAVPTQPPIGGRGAPPGMAGKSEPKPGPGKGTKRVKSNPDQAAMNGGTGQKKSTRRKKGGSSLG